eukprot:6400004-Amphidinium_carterae.1
MSDLNERRKDASSNVHSHKLIRLGVALLTRPSGEHKLQPNPAPDNATNSMGKARYVLANVVIPRTTKCLLNRKHFQAQECPSVKLHRLRSEQREGRISRPLQRIPRPVTETVHLRHVITKIWVAFLLEMQSRLHGS